MPKCALNGWCHPNSPTKEVINLPRKKTNIRQRILVAFFGVLFFAFVLTALVFDIGRQQIENSDAHSLLYYHGLLEGALYDRTHWFLLSFIGIIFLVAAVATYFLARTLTRPIIQLSQFAKRIGRGDFTPNNLEFADKELDDLNQALNKSVRQLSAYDHEQTVFFQNASHELRTPLMSIQCYAEGITSGIMSPTDAAQTILEETVKLNELIQEMLYISQIDHITSKYKKSETNLTQLILECVHRQQVQANKRNITLQTQMDNDIMYKCVPELISRAVDNLISNALRYAKSEITISLQVRGGYVGIKVADDGTGIAPDVIPHVFERFYKGQGGNTGIGLSIVKTIIEQHKGSVSVENAEQGALFTLILPS